MRRMGVISGHLILTCFSGLTGYRQDPRVLGCHTCILFGCTQIMIWDSMPLKKVEHVGVWTSIMITVKKIVPCVR